MATDHPDRGHAAQLIGRRGERERLDRLIKAVRQGEGQPLVLRGEPGVDKTALLEYLVEQAAEFRVLRAAGVQSEMEPAYAGLHQLLGPVLGRLLRLPPPQRDALRTMFSAGPPPDRFFVALAVLNLLSDAAADTRLAAQHNGPARTAADGTSSALRRWHSPIHPTSRTDPNALLRPGRSHTGTRRDKPDSAGPAILTVRWRTRARGPACAGKRGPT